MSTYTVIDLGEDFIANDINNLGDIAGYRIVDRGAGIYQAVLYSDGTKTDLGTLGGRSSFAYGINDLGQVVGHSDLPADSASGTPPSHAFLYSGDGMTDLGTLGGRNSFAYGGINNLGQVGGTADLPVDPVTGTSVFHAFLYSDGAKTDLGSLGGAYSNANGINNSGQVVGSARLTTTPGFGHAFLSSGGRLTDLRLLQGTDGNSIAFGINDLGQVVGWSDIANGGIHAFLYSGGMVDLGTLGGSESIAAGINNLDEVVGWADTANNGRHAFLYSSGVMNDLNSMIPSDSGWNLVNAGAINNVGEIIGGGVKEGRNHSVLLRPSFLVTNTNDDGAGSLRQAIRNAIEKPGTDTIRFRIDSGEQTIRLASPLPVITDPIIIDGTSQLGYQGTPLIKLDGSDCADGSGLIIRGGHSTVKGLEIFNFRQGSGIVLDENGGNKIGEVKHTTGTTITAGNSIHDNGLSGVTVLSGTGNSIRGNAIFNTGIPIDLGGDGPTSNTLPNSPHNGSNLLQSYPAISRVGNTVYLTLISTPGTTFVVDLYTVDSEGARFQREVAVTTDDLGTWFKEIDNFSLGADVNKLLTATATDPDGNTSEMLPGIGRVVQLAVPHSGPFPADLNLLAPALRAAVLEFQAALPSGVQLIPTSTYRPTYYQAHFYELKTKYLELTGIDGIEGTKQNGVPQLEVEIGGEGELYRGVVDKVNQEILGHGLQPGKQPPYAPSVNPPIGLAALHSRRAPNGTPQAEAVDLRFVGATRDELDDLADEHGLYRPFPESDPPHYQLLGVPGALGATVGTHSPIDLLITDPLGRRFGSDPDNGTFVNEIDPLITDTGPDSEPREIHFPLGSIVPGPYQISAVGTGSGPYTVVLEIWGEKEDGSLVEQVIATGTASPGVRIAPFSIDINQLAISPPPANEAPTDLALSATSVAENLPTSTIVGAFTTTDADAADSFTYSLEAGPGDADNASFTIDGTALRTAAVFDFEARSSYTIRVRTADQGGLTFERSFAITVADVNEAPTGLTLSGNAVAADSPAGTAVGTFQTADPDAGAALTYSLVTGPGDGDNTAFQISGDVLRTGPAFGTPGQTSYSIRVRVADQGGLSQEQGFTISATFGPPVDVTPPANQLPAPVAVATVGAFDPATGTWYLRNSNSPGAPDIAPFAYGAPGWIPVVGDWDGDGVATVGVFDPATGTWYLRNNNSPGAPDFAPFRYGAPGWVPVVGDWNGDGITTIGVFDPGTAIWYLRNSNSPGAPDFAPFAYGVPGWVPVVGDWNGDGVTSIGVFDPIGQYGRPPATWYLRNHNGPGAPDIAPFAYGGAQWRPVAGDWDGDGITTIGVIDLGGTWHLQNVNGPGAPGVVPFAYGAPGWGGVVGAWDRPAPALRALGENLSPAARRFDAPEAKSAPLEPAKNLRTQARGTVLDRLFAATALNADFLSDDVANA